MAILYKYFKVFRNLHYLSHNGGDYFENLEIVWNLYYSQVGSYD